MLPALATLLLAFAGVWPRRPNAVLGALTGAVAVQVVLRWPPTGFHGATALVCVAATGPCLLSAVRGLSAPARRRVRRWTWGLITLAVVVSVPVAIAAQLAHSELSQGIGEAQGALESIGQGTTGSGAAMLGQASSDFGSAASRTDSWWTAACTPGPGGGPATSGSGAGRGRGERRHCDCGLPGVGDRLPAAPLLRRPVEPSPTPNPDRSDRHRERPADVCQHGASVPAIGMAVQPGGVPPGPVGRQGLPRTSERLAGRAGSAGRTLPPWGRRRPPLLHRLHDAGRKPWPRRLDCRVRGADRRPGSPDVDPVG